RSRLRDLRLGGHLPRRGRHRRSRRTHVRVLRHRLLRKPRCRAEASRGRNMSAPESRPLLVAEGLGKRYGTRIGCEDVSLEIHEGEVVAVVGESGSGKSTLLGLLSTQLQPSFGTVRYRMRDGEERDLYSISEAERRLLLRTDWGFVHQD